MRTEETARNALTQIRHYLNNGFPRDRKYQLRGIQRRVELGIEKMQHGLEYRSLAK